MSKSLYITTTEPRSGKSAVVLGIMHMLLRDLQNVAFFRPIISSASGKDHDTNLILTHFGLDVPYERTYAYTLNEAREMVNQGGHALLLENILNKYKALEEEYDFVLCEGTDFQGNDPAFEFDINADIAANIGTPVLVVNKGAGKDADEIVQSTALTVESYEEKGVDILSVIVNRAEVGNSKDLIADLHDKVKTSGPGLYYVIPENPLLGRPTVNDVRKWLDAQVLYGHGRLQTQVDDFLVAAMQIGNFLDYIDQGSLIVTPGDRSDIIVAALASRLSSSYPDIAGLVLTGDLQPSTNVHRLIEGWTGVPVPILSVKGHTYATTRKLDALYGRIEPDDQVKLASALGSFEDHVATRELAKEVISSCSTKVTPKMFEFNLIENAKRVKQRIVLPEGTSARVLQAADILLRRGVADIILLGQEDKIAAIASEHGLQLADAQIINPATSPKFEEYWKEYLELRKHKGLREEDARDRMTDTTYFATMMVHMGDADGMVSGSVTTTAQTIRPAFEFIRTKPTASIVSSVFLMCLKDRVLVYGDCAVNPNPTAEQLAEIALSSAETAILFGVTPKIAMLSYSSGQSGKGEQVEKVKEATRIAKERRPDLLIEGPIQYDAAVDMDVARTKMPDSQVAGQATVFVFPDLNTGNNTYKAVQRSANAVAIGPVLQGLNKPVNDLSRGCTIPDIVNTVAITAVQARAESEAK